VTCDACGDPWPARSLVLYRRYAICLECIEMVRSSDAADDVAAAADGVYAAERLMTNREIVAREGEYTPSATIVRRIFGLAA